MAQEILVNVTPHETRVAVLEHGIVEELHVERANACGFVGNIYLGKIVRVLPGMQSAFIDIGLERAAFLHVADIYENRTHENEAKPIERLLREGQSLLVQVIKDPLGAKGARLSTQISLAGRFLVYLPQDTHIGISQRIEDETERETLREKLRALLSEDSELLGGFIVRTMAETATEEDLKADIDYLTCFWRDLLQRIATLPTPSLLHQDFRLHQRLLRDVASETTATIFVDDVNALQSMREFSQRYATAIADKLFLYQSERPLFERFGVEDELNKALARRVDLKSGGYLIFDQTEALASIDVNTGAFVDGHNFEETVFKTNLEAAHAIARQLRLRNLGGIIIIDFIDMDRAEHQQAVLEELNRALQKDRTRLSVNGFTRLGLVEMTRKRTRESLAHMLSEACPVCFGRGQMKTPQTICYEILREIEREAHQYPAREFRILASQAVIDRFLDEDSQSLVWLADKIGKIISMQVETLYTQEQYDIVIV
ncbi:MAG: ribonuclease G [Burkholderiales bacterium]|jgi:ribonuclease G|nr:ribonuclease G [Burkholderiales bacterium]